MSLILWMQLAVGLAVLIYGVVGPDATRRTLVVLGCLNAGNGGALLLLGQGGSLGVVAIIAYGMSWPGCCGRCPSGSGGRCPG